MKKPVLATIGAAVCFSATCFAPILAHASVQNSQMTAAFQKQFIAKDLASSDFKNAMDKLMNTRVDVNHDARITLPSGTTLVKRVVKNQQHTTASNAFLKPNYIYSQEADYTAEVYGTTYFGIVEVDLKEECIWTYDGQKDTSQPNQICSSYANWPTTKSGGIRSWATKLDPSVWICSAQQDYNSPTTQFTQTINAHCNGDGSFWW